MRFILKLTQERLQELLTYNPETGIFTWNINKSSKAQKNSVAGCSDNYGYIIITIDNKPYKAHRLAFLYVSGYTPELYVDHIDRDKANNKWANLREVSPTCNRRNLDTSTRNTSGVIGVCWDKRSAKWKVRIATPLVITIGHFTSLLDAAEARWKAEVKYNFPNCNTTSSAYKYLKDHGII